MGTPVPIPNTEVKHRSGEGSRGTDKNSELPGFFFYGAPTRVLFLFFFSLRAIFFLGGLMVSKLLPISICMNRDKRHKSLRVFSVYLLAFLSACSNKTQLPKDPIIEIDGSREGLFFYSRTGTAFTPEGVIAGYAPIQDFGNLLEKDPLAKKPSYGYTVSSSLSDLSTSVTVGYLDADGEPLLQVTDSPGWIRVGYTPAEHYGALAKPTLEENRILVDYESFPEEAAYFVISVYFSSQIYGDGYGIFYSVL